jgi:hypothetical protein
VNELKQGLSPSIPTLPDIDCEGKSLTPCLSYFGCSGGTGIRLIEVYETNRFLIHRDGALSERLPQPYATSSSITCIRLVQLW